MAWGDGILLGRVLVRFTGDTRMLGAHVAHRATTVTLFPFGQATRSGLLSMQAPVAKAAQVIFTGATNENSMANGAADLSSMANLYDTPLSLSVQEDRFRF